MLVSLRAPLRGSRWRRLDVPKQVLDVGGIVEQERACVKSD
jgi:hypothetical protein